MIDPLSQWTQFWYEKALAYFPQIQNRMTSIQSSIFWNLLQRIFYNPVSTAFELSIRELNAFLAAAVEKLTFDSLTEMSKGEQLSPEAQRFQIIKTILQEYSDVIIGKDLWLSKNVLGNDLYTHLVNPEKVKDMKNRQKQFKQYKKSGPLDLLALIRNFRTHYDQQPLELRQKVFNHKNLDHVAAVQDYYSYFDKKFPGFLLFVLEAASFAKSSALGEFYYNPCTVDILDFDTCYASFAQLFQRHFNHLLDYERFKKLFEQTLKQTKFLSHEIVVNQSWIEDMEDKFEIKEKLPKTGRKMSDSSMKERASPMRKQRKNSRNSTY